MTQNARSGHPRSPWPAVVVLSAATMLMVTAEMLPTAVLGRMSTGLDVAEADIGALVSLWAAVVVVVSFPLSRLARTRRARPVIVVALLVLALSSMLTALAPSFGFAVLARVLGAGAVGLLWATVNAFVADLVPDRLLVRAIGIVLGGGTLGMVIGTPLARLLADAGDWRWAFAALGAALGAAAIAVRVTVPLRDRQDVRPDRPGEGAAHRSPALLPVAFLVAICLVGHYGAYTFITRLAGSAAPVLPGGMSGLLLVFGLSSALGVGVAAWFGEHTTASLVIALAVTGAAIASLSAAAAAAPALSIAIVVLWGVGSGAFPPLAQTLILRIAGPGRRDFAGALIPVLFNGGIALGAGAASALVGAAGPLALPLPAAAIVLVASVLVGFVASPRAAARTAERAEARRTAADSGRLV